MIHSADPQSRQYWTFVFTWNLFCFARFWKVGTDVRTDYMCENDDHYRPWLWVGRVDQYKRNPLKLRNECPFLLHKLRLFPPRSSVLLLLLAWSMNPPGRNGNEGVQDSFWSTRPTHQAPARSDHYFHNCRTFQNLAKENNFSSGTNFHYWRDFGAGRVDHWWLLSCFLYFFSTCFFNSSWSGRSVVQYSFTRCHGRSKKLHMYILQFFPYVPINSSC